MRRKRNRTPRRPFAALILIVVLAALVVLLGAGTALAANHWSDITDQQWIDVYHVTAAQAQTVAAGYPDGTFRPGLAVNRGQFAKMVVTGLGLGTANPLAATFSDVSTTDYYFPWVEGAYLAGVISGYPDGTFRPSTAVSRQEADSILGRYLSQKELSLTGHIQGELTTYPTVSAWYAAEGAERLDAFADASSLASVDAPYAAYLVYHEVVEGSSRSGGVYLDPGSSLTRAQAVALILRVEGVTFIGPVTAAQSTVVAVPTSVPADGTTTSTITVTLKDLNSNPVAGKTVTLAKTSGPGTPTISAASGVSSALGVVTFTVKSTTAGADVFTATDTTDTVVITQTATVTFTGPVTAAQSTVVALPTSVTADGTTTSTITVTLKDGLSNPVAGKTVTLAKTSGPGTPTIGAASGVSSASGVVTFTVKSTTAGADVFTATDTTDAVVITQTATVTFTAGPVTAAQSTVVAVPTSVPADGTTTSTITVTLKDLNSNPVAGKTVALAKTSGPGTPTISAASGVSSALGVVTFTVKSTTAGADVFTATDTTDASLVITQTATVTFTATAAQSTVTALPTSVTADGTTTSTITVTLKDGLSNPVAGKTVALAKTSGPGTPTIGLASGVSNASGVVTFTVKSTTAGADVFTATDTTDAVVITQTATVTFTAGPVTAAQSTVVAVPTSVPADGTTTSTITVTLKDAHSNPVAGKTVSLAQTSGPGTPTIGAASGVSSASGVVTFTVKSTTAGADVFTATDTTDASLVITQTATVTFTATAAQSTVVAFPPP